MADEQVKYHIDNDAYRYADKVDRKLSDMFMDCCYAKALSCNSFWKGTKIVLITKEHVETVEKHLVSLLLRQVP